MILVRHLGLRACNLRFELHIVLVVAMAVVFGHRDCLLIFVRAEYFVFSLLFVLVWFG